MCFLFIAELPHIRIFPLTFTSYSIILTLLNMVLELAVVTSLLAVKKTPEPLTGVYFNFLTFANNIEPFCERIAAQAIITLL
jgi:hypothetical protein